MSVPLTDEELEAVRTLWEIAHDAHLSHSQAEGKIRDMNAQAEVLWYKSKLATQHLKDFLRSIVVAKGEDPKKAWRVDTATGLLLSDDDPADGMDLSDNGDVN